jgi:hypothetical protein
MDEKKEITHIIANLRDELDYAKAELSRLNFKDEAAEEYGKAHDPNAADEAQRPQQPQNRHSGVAMLPIHYTLGQGIPEALGDDLDPVVFSIFPKIASATNEQGIGELEVSLRGIGMLATSFWDRERRLVCLHLERAHTQQCRDEEDWEEDEHDMYLERSLN